MTTHVLATVVGGLLKPDHDLSLPEHSRVNLTVETVDEVRDPLKVWESLLERLSRDPINSGGLRYTRDELHERR